MDSYTESLRRSQRRREKARRERIRRIRLRGGSGSLALVALVVAIAGGGVAAGQTIHRASTQSGGSVASVQRALGIPADGIAGPQTRRAVRAFQRRKGLVVDGIIGPQTRAALGLGSAPAAASPSGSGSGSGSGTSTGSAGSGRLQQIARCESGGNPRAIGGGGQYRGKYQFTRETWAAVGGSGDPAAAPEAEQDRRAAALLARNGTGQWPVCGH
jgi:peptidoglycan hydrolase-like protein with peptidoglycan-binding domain